jgi:hypothetical protein
MRRVRLWLKGSCRLPDGAHIIAVAACGVLRLGDVVSPEWGWFVLLPGLFGLAHVVAPRQVWGGKLYWGLAGVWFAAVVAGLLAHWEMLEPHTPWFSLVRYVLIALGGTVWWVGPLLGRPSFVAAAVVPERDKRLPARILAAGMLAIWLFAVGVVISATPFRAAMTPRLRGAKLTRAWSAPAGKWISRVAWSPDSRDLLVQVNKQISSRRSEHEIWLVTPSEGKAERVVERGSVAVEGPWLPSGDGFYYRRVEEEGGGVWLASRGGRERTQVMDEAGTRLVSRSPRGDAIVLRSGGKLWLAEAGGSGRRPLSGTGSWVRWSPDGKRLAFVRGSGQKREVWVAARDGSSRQVPMSDTDFDDYAWVTDDSLATMEVVWGAHHWWPLVPRMVNRMTVRLWNLDGEELRRFPFTTLGTIWAVMAVAPGGERIGFGPGEPIAIREWRGKVLLLDLETEELHALAEDVGVTSLSWSPDGKSLAVLAAERPWRKDDVAGEEATEYVAVISGL